jgi:Cu(I)/Ag(I) efflux system membrane fusion protein
MKKMFVILLIAVAAVGGWYFGKHGASAAGDHSNHADAKPEKGGRKILYYQSAMHPWIKSDKPGNCTICGMKLTPVYEGDKPVEVDTNIVQLSSNSVTVLNVQSTEVTERPLKRTIRAAGTIEDDETRHRFISAYVAGRIDELYFNYVGAEVTQGSPLAKFYSPDLLAAEWEYVTLARNTNTPTAIALEAHHPLLQAAGLRLKRLGLTDAQIAALPQKKSETQHSEIVAPIGGTILNRFVYPGQYVMEGEKLFEIADFSKMWFQANIYERDLPWIRTGQVVRVTAPALPGRVFGGRVIFLNPTINEMTRSAIVRIELENPFVEVDGQKKRLLYHKLFADAEFEVETSPLLAVDRTAVINPGGKPIVYVDLGGGGYEQRLVKLGRRGDEAWEVLEGLEKDEKVVTEGNLMIDSQAQLNHGAGHTEHAHGTSQSGQAPEKAEHVHTSEK